MRESFELGVVNLRETKDGSKTLHNEDLQVFYHSVHGAWTETQHVFGTMGIEEGLRRVEQGELRVLEVGLGTGLNVLETWRLAHDHQRHIHMVSLEPFPLQWEEVRALDYAATTGTPMEVWRAVIEEGRHEDAHFNFRTIHQKLENAPLEERTFDVVLFDAFAPVAQPELWEVGVFDRLRFALRPGGQLVTYCAKGNVRRAMEDAGFQVERIAGPPGKREMLRATRVASLKNTFNVRCYLMITRSHPGTGELEMLMSYERLPMGGVMKFPGGGLEWGEGAAACARREALEELGVAVGELELIHVSSRAHISSFDASQQVVAVHYATQLSDAESFLADGELGDVFGKRVPLMHQRLGWKAVAAIEPKDFHFASDREAWESWRQSKQL